MELEIEATPVFRNIQKYENDFKILLLQGGSRSSKTWSIFQHYIVKALSGEKFILTICRANLTWVKTTLLKDLEAMVEKYNIPISPPINTNRQEQVYYINGSEFAFFGLDTPEKLHGRTQDYSWLNEVIEMGKKEFDQLEMRTKKKMMIDFNPSDDTHWVFELERRDDVKLIKSTMLDNPFLPESITNKIKSYEPTERNIQQGTADNYMWEVYGLGNKAKLIGAIFTNWDIQELPNRPRLLGYGLDFGYTNDPTALVGCYLHDNEIWLDELIYQTALTNQDIIKLMRSLEVRDVTWADSSEPKSIEEIKRGGLYVMPVEKGQDSINYGIDIMKSYKIHITPRSINLQNEFRKYKWLEDKQGKTINKPIDAFNHGVDASRYLISSVLKTRVSQEIKSGSNAVETKPVSSRFYKAKTINSF